MRRIAPARRTRTIALAICAAVTAVSLAACGGSDGGGSSVDEGGAEGVDDGSTLTLWTRAPVEKQAKALVAAYNASHENQVELTVVPNDDYVAKVGAAAGSDGLPDLFAADIVYVPNWVEQGLFQDVTDRVGALDFKDELNSGHMEAGTSDGSQHVLPFVLDISVMFWNKELYREAGLDPEQGPTTLAEFADHAKQVDALGGDVNGTYFGGNCGGCGVFTWFPSIWAAGDEVMNDDGTESLLDSESAQAVYSTWRDLVESDAVAPGARDEAGPTWVAPFQNGQVGVQPYPATLLSTASETVDVGVGPLVGPDGGESTFVGGDGIGVSKDSEQAAQAWNFLSWLVSEEAQVEVLAQGGDAVSRNDLTDNQYAAEDPRVVTVNEIAAQGKTPIARNFQQAFNAPDSPWLTLIREQVFGDAAGLEDENQRITEILGQ